MHFYYLSIALCIFAQFLFSQHKSFNLVIALHHVECFRNID